MSDSSQPSPDLCIDSFKKLLHAEESSLTLTAPVPNQGTPSSSPVKKKIKVEEIDEIIGSEFEQKVKVEYLNTFLLAAIISKKLDMNALSIPEICKVWREECPIDDQEYSKLKTQLESNLHLCLEKELLVEALPLPTLESFNFDVVVSGHYYFVDNYKSKFPLTKILSLLSNEKTKLIGILSDKDNILLDRRKSIPLQTNKSLTIKEIIVDSEIEFIGILCSSLTKLDCVSTFEFFSQNKGLIGGGDDDTEELIEAYKKDLPQATILTKSEYLKNVKLPNLTNCLLNVYHQ